MKIVKGKRGNVIATLGREDTKKWEDGTERGDKFRRGVREETRAFAAKHKLAGNIEIFAASTAGGWVADFIRAGD